MNLAVEQMKKCNAKVVGSQETKWFGNEMYKIRNAVVLTSGQVRPSNEAHFYKGEGVAVVLLDWAIDAWKAAGSQWKA